MAQDFHVTGDNALAYFLLLFDLAGTQVNTPCTKLLLRTALNAKISLLEIFWHIALQTA